MFEKSVNNSFVIIKTLNIVVFYEKIVFPMFLKYLLMKLKKDTTNETMMRYWCFKHSKDRMKEKNPK